MGSPNERVPNSTETVGKVGEGKCIQGSCCKYK